MKYKFLTVLTVLTITASAENNLNTRADWESKYRGQPTQIVEGDLRADQLLVLTLVSPSLKAQLKTLNLSSSPITKLPDLKNLTRLEVLAIDNKGPININPNDLPSSLKTLALNNDSNHFSKPGIKVISYNDYVRSINYN